MKKPKASMDEIDTAIKKSDKEREQHYEATRKKVDDYMQLAKNADTKGERKKYLKQVRKTAVKGMRKSHKLTAELMRLIRKKHGML